MKPPSRPLTPPLPPVHFIPTRLMNLLPRMCRAGLPRVLMLKQQILQCLPADICMHKCMRAYTFVCTRTYTVRACLYAFVLVCACVWMCARANVLDVVQLYTTNVQKHVMMMMI